VEDEVGCFSRHGILSKPVWQKRLKAHIHDVYYVTLWSVIDYRVVRRCGVL